MAMPTVQSAGPPAAVVDVPVPAIAAVSGEVRTGSRLAAFRGASWLRLGVCLAFAGPGVMVMLADTDAGSVITAAQSGASFGYRLVLPQLVLIPVLYVVQEITVRLGMVTGKGHGSLIVSNFGQMWGWVSAATLFAACMGALITEFAGVAGAAALAGIPRAASVTAAALFVLVLVLLGGHRRVEYVGIAVGLLELLFIPAALLARPHPAALAVGLARPLLATHGYWTLLAANVGAVIMPWMIFYQQSAVVDKANRGLALRDGLRSARAGTLAGSVATQLIMISIVVATAATIGTGHSGAALHSVGEITVALTPFLGQTGALVLFGMGIIGASLIAALVVALAGAWGVAEVLGWRHSLNDSPAQAIGFYTLSGLALAGGAALVVAAPNLVNLSVSVEVMNACLLPLVLGFLLALERLALPAQLRMRGARLAGTYVLSGLVITLGLYTTVGQLLRIC